MNPIFVFGAQITYFMIGLYMSAGRFFTFYIILVSVTINYAALFRMIAHVCPDGMSANAYSVLVQLILLAMTGYNITRLGIPDYWIWVRMALLIAMMPLPSSLPPLPPLLQPPRSWYASAPLFSWKSVKRACGTTAWYA